MSDVLIEQADGVVTVTLNRPPVNALTLALYERVADVFEQLGDTLDINCAVLTGSGTRAFCAGLDLKEFLTAKPEDDPQRARIVRRTFTAVRNCKIPVIAAVNGPALGAGSVLASVCDIRIAAENATFGMPEINIGRCGGGAHHGRYIPQGALRRMFFTGRPISATEAYRLGLVDELVSGEALMNTARTLAREIASKSPLGLRLGKQALNEIEFMEVDAGYAVEQSYSTKLLHTLDAKEATRAAIEKRKPVWQGK